MHFLRVNLMNQKQSDQFEQLNRLMAAFVADPSAQLRTEIQTMMNLDDTNFSAFMVLFDALKNPKIKPRLEIFEPGQNSKEGAVAYPTAIAPADILSKLPYVSYADLLARSAEYRKISARCSLWVKKMQAGTGSTVVRDDYVKKIRAGMGETGETTQVGAKGTDLYVELPGSSGLSEYRSLAELQIMQQMIAQENKEFCEIIFQDLVSPETADSLERIWKKPSYLHAPKTYSEKVAKRAKRFVQSHVPCIDETYKLTYDRTAPSGHWIFAVDALRAAVHPELRPTTACAHTVAVIGNGEDLSSTPDPAMVGWMIAEKIPIVMVTTEKTANDLKGGQIALVRTPAGEDYVTIIEQAQAKEAGQLELFEKIGVTLKNDDQMAFFNTNMALFNYDVLVPLIQKLSHEIGERAFLDLLGPDLIMNWKVQEDSTGRARKYLQIEGAMGSSLLNFDRYWRQRYGHPLVHFINVEREHRTQFFSPIKTAFDYFMQFHSDRFSLDTKTMKLSHVGAERLPLVVLKDPATHDTYYADVSTVLSNFAGASIRDLTELTIKGQVTARDLTFAGRVEISNESGLVADISAVIQTLTGTHKMRDQKLTIDSAGRAVLTPLQLHP
jgi:hypothetical protein